jgi:hypothetical protein
MRSDGNGRADMSGNRCHAEQTVDQSQAARMNRRRMRGATGGNEVGIGELTAVRESNRASTDLAEGATVCGRQKARDQDPAPHRKRDGENYREGSHCGARDPIRRAERSLFSIFEYHCSGRGLGWRTN